MRVRYMLGFCRIYGKEFHPQVWTEVGDKFVRKVQNAAGWEIEGEEPEVVPEVVLEEVEEEVIEVEEEVIEVEEDSDEEEGLDLTTLTKKELQALCDEQGLSYKSLDNKSTLIGIL